MPVIMGLLTCHAVIFLVSYVKRSYSGAGQFGKVYEGSATGLQSSPSRILTVAVKFLAEEGDSEEEGVFLQEAARMVQACSITTKGSNHLYLISPAYDYTDIPLLSASAGSFKGAWLFLVNLLLMPWL